jgi:type II secretory pathway pseudopilin PulG
MRVKWAIISLESRGITLIETMAAVVVALIGVFSLGSVIFVASATDKNQGSEATRATVYAQDKIESLLALNFSQCTQAPSAQPVTCNTTGISAGSWTHGLLAGGAISPASPSCGSSGSNVGYQDFLMSSGSQFTGTSCAAVTGPIAYVRQWQITDLTPFSGGPSLKQITVAVYSMNAINQLGGNPIVVVTSVYSNPN